MHDSYDIKRIRCYVLHWVFTRTPCFNWKMVFSSGAMKEVVLLGTDHSSGLLKSTYLDTVSQFEYINLSDATTVLCTWCLCQNIRREFECFPFLTRRASWPGVIWHLGVHWAKNSIQRFWCFLMGNWMWMCAYHQENTGQVKTEPIWHIISAFWNTNGKQACENLRFPPFFQLQIHSKHSNVLCSFSPLKAVLLKSCLFLDWNTHYCREEDVPLHDLHKFFWLDMVKRYSGFANEKQAEALTLSAPSRQFEHQKKWAKLMDAFFHLYHRFTTRKLFHCESITLRITAMASIFRGNCSQQIDLTAVGWNILLVPVCEANHKPNHPNSHFPPRNSIFAEFQILWFRAVVR